MKKRVETDKETNNPRNVVCLWRNGNRHLLGPHRGYSFGDGGGREHTKVLRKGIVQRSTITDDDIGGCRATVINVKILK